MADQAIYRCPSCGFTLTVSYTASGEGPDAEKTAEKNIEEMEKGFYGRADRNFLEVDPEGAVSNEMALYQCQECGELSNRPKLNLYLPKEGTAPSEKKAHTNCTLVTQYRLYKTYPHICRSCGGEMMLAADYQTFHRNKVLCPHGDDFLELEE